MKRTISDIKIDLWKELVLLPIGEEEYKRAATLAEVLIQEAYNLGREDHRIYSERLSKATGHPTVPVPGVYSKEQGRDRAEREAFGHMGGDVVQYPEFED